MSQEVSNAEVTRDISTLLLPIVGQQLVVPNVAVAEILELSDVQAEDDVPTWYLGLLPWRNTRVPLISFEALNDQPFFSRTEESRVAIFNGVTDSGNMPFWGLITQGVPRQMRVLPDEITEEVDVTLGAAEKMAVVVGDEHARIPDLDYIEQQLLALRQR